MTKYLEMMEQAAQYMQEAKPRLSGPSDIANFMRPLFLDAKQESFYVLLVSAKNDLLDFQCVTVGLVDRSHIHAREVFRRAIIRNACRIMLSHNHPSGDPTPSAPDIECTRNLVNAGKIIGIDVVDHVVIGFKTPERHRDYLSFREENLL
jgi:DNA repair protein RadC